VGQPHCQCQTFVASANPLKGWQKGPTAIGFAVGNTWSRSAARPLQRVLPHTLPGAPVGGWTQGTAVNVEPGVTYKRHHLPLDLFIACLVPPDCGVVHLVEILFTRVVLTSTTYLQVWPKARLELTLLCRDEEQRGICFYGNGYHQLHKRLES